MSKALRSLTGIRATGQPHVGNYLGTIRPAIRLQDSHECLYFIADLHSLTSTKNGVELAEQRLDVLATWIACGFDYKKNILFAQSDVPSVTELAWYLSCVTGMGLLEKGHSYKDACAKDTEVNHGVFSYPVLMAADILLYDVDLVPVGKDQKQHVEMARDMAGSFNAIFGEGLLKLPTPSVREEVMVIPGLDGRKMSKSYGNTIPLFCEEKELKKLIMSIKTDSSGLDEPKILDGSLVGELFKHFSSDEQYEDLKARLAKGGLGWGHAKAELFELINHYISSARTTYNELRGDIKLLTGILDEGRSRAFALAGPVLNRVRAAIGVRPFGFTLR